LAPVRIAGVPDESVHTPQGLAVEGDGHLGLGHGETSKYEDISYPERSQGTSQPAGSDSASAVRHGRDTLIAGAALEISYIKLTPEEVEVQQRCGFTSDNIKVRRELDEYLRVLEGEFRAAEEKGKEQDRLIVLSLTRLGVATRRGS
jgi:hypothetical protein